MAQQIDIGVFSVIDIDSSIGVGWKLWFYASGTSNEVDTYPTEDDAIALNSLNANSNPVVISSDGRLPPIWITQSVKLILTDENDDVEETIDPIKYLDFTDVWEVRGQFIGVQDTAGGWMGGVIVKRACTFPADFAGSVLMSARGEDKTDPAAEQIISVTRNEVEYGTMTVDTDGSWYFATTDNDEWSAAEGDYIDFYGPDTPGTGADFKWVLVASYD